MRESGRRSLGDASTQTPGCPVSQSYGQPITACGQKVTAERAEDAEKEGLLSDTPRRHDETWNDARWRQNSIWPSSASYPSSHNSARSAVEPACGQPITAEERRGRRESRFTVASELVSDVDVRRSRIWNTLNVGAKLTTLHPALLGELRVMRVIVISTRFHAKSAGGAKV
jgi:hypothetical protein